MDKRLYADLWEFAGSAHEINHVPGKNGKGLVTPEGEVHTWKTDSLTGVEPIHNDYITQRWPDAANRLDARGGHTGWSYFYINEDGKIGAWYGGGGTEYGQDISPEHQKLLKKNGLIRDEDDEQWVFGSIHTSMPYDDKRDEQWHSGDCAEYALAMQQLYPDLRLGIMEEHNPNQGELVNDWLIQNPEEDFFHQHIFAHDDLHAYDVYGKKPLPQDFTEPDGREYRHTFDYSPEEIEWQWPIRDHLIEEAKQRIQQHSSPDELPGSGGCPYGEFCDAERHAHRYKKGDVPMTPQEYCEYYHQDGQFKKVAATPVEVDSCHYCLGSGKDPDLHPMASSDVCPECNGSGKDEYAIAREPTTWAKGQQGKGFINPDGRMRTWPTGGPTDGPHHREMGADPKGLALWIDPDGSTHSYADVKLDDQQLKDHHPDLFARNDYWPDFNGEQQPGTMARQSKRHPLRNVDRASLSALTDAVPSFTPHVVEGNDFGRLEDKLIPMLPTEHNATVSQPTGASPHPIMLPDEDERQYLPTPRKPHRDQQWFFDPTEMYQHPYPMPQHGIEPGQPGTPMYRYMAIPKGEDPQQYLGENKASGTGTHWTHDYTAVRRLVNDWWDDPEDTDAVVLHATHPGEDHIMDWSDPRDKKIMEDTIVGEDYKDHAYPAELPIRPNAPINVHGVDVFDGSYDDNHEYTFQHLSRRNSVNMSSRTTRRSKDAQVDIQPVWDFPSSSEVDDPNVYVTRHSGYNVIEVDSTINEVSPWTDDRRPILTDDANGRIYVGAPGTHHHDLEYGIQDGHDPDFTQDRANAAWGNTNAEGLTHKEEWQDLEYQMTMDPGNLTQEHRNAVNEYFGHPPEEHKEWGFTGSVNDNEPDQDHEEENNKFHTGSVSESYSHSVPQSRPSDEERLRHNGVFVNGEYSHEAVGAKSSAMTSAERSAILLKMPTVRALDSPSVHESVPHPFAVKPQQHVGVDNLISNDEGIMAKDGTDHTSSVSNSPLPPLVRGSWGKGIAQQGQIYLWGTQATKDWPFENDGAPIHSDAASRLGLGLTDEALLVLINPSGAIEDAYTPEGEIDPRDHPMYGETQQKIVDLTGPVEQESWRLTGAAHAARDNLMYHASPTDNRESSHNKLAAETDEPWKGLEDRVTGEKYKWLMNEPYGGPHHDDALQLLGLDPHQCEYVDYRMVEDDWPEAKWIDPRESQGMPQGFRTSAAPLMYHVAPGSARKQIMANGLMPQQQADKLWLESQDAVHLWDNDGDAYDWIEWSNEQGHDWAAPWDVYEIDVSGLTLEPDPEARNAYVTQAIPADRITMILDETGQRVASALANNPSNSLAVPQHSDLSPRARTTAGTSPTKDSHVEYGVTEGNGANAWDLADIERGNDRPVPQTVIDKVDDHLHRTSNEVAANTFNDMATAMDNPDPVIVRASGTHTKHIPVNGNGSHTVSRPTNVHNKATHTKHRPTPNGRHVGIPTVDRRQVSSKAHSPTVAHSTVDNPLPRKQEDLINEAQLINRGGRGPLQNVGYSEKYGSHIDGTERDDGHRAVIQWNGRLYEGQDGEHHQELASRIGLDPRSEDVRFGLQWTGEPYEGWPEDGIHWYDMEGPEGQRPWDNWSFTGGWSAGPYKRDRTAMDRVPVLWKKDWPEPMIGEPGQYHQSFAQEMGIDFPDEDLYCGLYEDGNIQWYEDPFQKGSHTGSKTAGPIRLHQTDSEPNGFETPIIWHPSTNDLYIGGQGATHHVDLANHFKLPWQEIGGDEGEWFAGILDPFNGNLTWYTMYEPNENVEIYEVLKKTLPYYEPDLEDDPEGGGWDFTGNRGPTLDRTAALTVHRDVYDPNQEDHGLAPRDAKAFVYHPGQNALYVGTMGSAHHGVLQAIEGAEVSGDKFFEIAEDYQLGRVNYNGNNVDVENYDEHKGALPPEVHEALGVSKQDWEFEFTGSFDQGDPKFVHHDDLEIRNPWENNRNALIYDADNHVVHVGPPGGHHYPLLQETGLAMNPENNVFGGFRVPGEKYSVWWNKYRGAEEVPPPAGVFTATDRYFGDPSGGAFEFTGSLSDGTDGPGPPTIDRLGEFSGEEEQWYDGRQPVIYWPEQNYAIVGDPNTHHFDYFPSMEDRERGSDADFVVGTYWPESGFDWNNSVGNWGNGDTPHPDVTKAINEYFGINSGEEPEWQFTGSAPLEVVHLPHTEDDHHGGTAFIYDKTQDKLYYGGRGSYHDALYDQMVEDGTTAHDNPYEYSGRVEDTSVYFYDRQYPRGWPPNLQERIVDALQPYGAQPAQVSNWGFEGRSKLKAGSSQPIVPKGLNPPQDGKRYKALILRDGTQYAWAVDNQQGLPHHLDAQLIEGIRGIDCERYIDSTYHREKEKDWNFTGAKQPYYKRVYAKLKSLVTHNDHEWGLAAPSVTVHEPKGFDLNAEHAQGSRVPFIYDHHPEDKHDIHVYLGHPGSYHDQISTYNPGEAYGHDEPAMYTEEEMPEWVGWHGTGSLKPAAWFGGEKNRPAQQENGAIEFYGGPPTNEYAEPDYEEDEQGNYIYPPGPYQIDPTDISNALRDRYKDHFQLPEPKDWSFTGSGFEGGGVHFIEGDYDPYEDLVTPTRWDEEEGDYVAADPVRNWDNRLPWLSNGMDFFVGQPGEEHESLWQNAEEQGHIIGPEPVTGTAMIGEFSSMIPQGRVAPLNGSRLKPEALQKLVDGLQERHPDVPWHSPDLEDWKFTGNFSWTTPMIQWVETRDSDHGAGHAFIYDPTKDVIYLGKPGSWHMDIRRALGVNTDEHYNNTLGGRIDPNNVTFYQRWDEDQKEQVLEALRAEPGLDQSNYGIHDFTNYRDYDTREDWGFTGKVRVGSRPNPYEIIESPTQYSGDIDDRWDYSWRRAWLFDGEKIYMGQPNIHHAQLTKEFGLPNTAIRGWVIDPNHKDAQDALRQHGKPTGLWWNHHSEHSNEAVQSAQKQIQDTYWPGHSNQNWGFSG